METWPNLKAAVANVIIRLRSNADMSQWKLAKESYIDRVYISHLEKCKYNLTLNVLCYIAKGLGLKASDFVKLVEDEMDVLQKQQRIDNEQ